jgi:hypothetical protein
VVVALPPAAAAGATFIGATPPSAMAFDGSGPPPTTQPLARLATRPIPTPRLASRISISPVPKNVGEGLEVT